MKSLIFLSFVILLCLACHKAPEPTRYCWHCTFGYDYATGQITPAKDTCTESNDASKFFFVDGNNNELLFTCTPK